MRMIGGVMPAWSGMVVWQWGKSLLFATLPVLLLVAPHHRAHAVLCMNSGERSRPKLGASLGSSAG